MDEGSTSGGVLWSREGTWCIALTHTPTAPSDKANIIVIYCDNLGYGDIEPFGSTLHRTPNLNRMAKEGRKFTHFCVTAGVCTPSRASIMTGCYPQRVGMHLNPRDGWVLRPVSQYGLHPDEVTVAEVLKDQGLFHERLATHPVLMPNSNQMTPKLTSYGSTGR